MPEESIAAAARMVEELIAEQVHAVSSAVAKSLQTLTAIAERLDCGVSMSHPQLTALPGSDLFSFEWVVQLDSDVPKGEVHLHEAGWRP